MITAILVALYVGILLFDFKPGLKQAGKGEKIAYLAILTIGFAAAVAYGMGVGIPSPAYPIEHAVRAVFGVE